MCPFAFLSRRAASPVAALLSGMLLAGCAAAGNQDSSPPPSLLDKLLAAVPSSESKPAPVEDRGCGTPSQCRSALKKMVDSPNRGWVGEAHAPAEYTDGTRLFAYRALRRKLTCRELARALTEVRTVSKSLAGDVPGVSRDQLSRTRALNGQVEGELAKERRVRCKA